MHLLLRADHVIVLPRSIQQCVLEIFLWTVFVEDKCLLKHTLLL